MKEKRYNRLQMVAVVIALLLTSLLPSCSNDDSNSPDLPDDKLYTLTINLQPSSSYAPVTKAEGAPSFVEEERTYEHRIKECWVAIFDAEGNWKATVSTKDFTINNNHDESESSATVKLPIGTYTFYAFANLNSLLDNDTGIIKELESGKLSDKNTDLTEKYLKNKAVSLKSRNNFVLPTGETATETGLPIPMSSYATTATVEENGTNEVKLTLFRMLGKVTITIDNQTGESKYLKNLSIGSFRNGPIYLLPYSNGNITLDGLFDTDAAEQLQPIFPNDATTNNEIVKIKENNDTDINANQQYSVTFYAFETGTETNSPAGDISLSIQIGNRPESTKKTDFSFMRRNDWLKIPIILSNIESRIKFLNNRMPIGALPPVVVFGEGDGTQILVDAVNTIDPTYAGPIDIEVTLKSINNAQGTPDILYTVEQTEGTDRSTAVLENNTNGLLIDETTGSPLATNGTEKVTFKVTASPSDKTAKNKCYFRVWAQELGEKSIATIKLTIVAEYGTETPKRRIEIPYTIIIQNYKNETTTN